MGHGQLAFQGLLLADVEKHLIGQELAALIGRDDGPHDRNDFAVRAFDEQLPVDAALGFERTTHPGVVRAGLVSPTDVFPGFADEAFPGKADDLGGDGVDLDDAEQGWVDDADTRPDAAQNLAQHLCVLDGFPFGPFSVRDVGDDADQPLGPFFGIVVQRFMEQDVADRSARRGQRGLIRLRASGGEEFRVFAGKSLGPLRGKQIVDRLADHLLPGQPEEFFGGLVAPLVAPGNVLEIDGRGRRIHERLDKAQFVAQFGFHGLAPADVGEDHQQVRPGFDLEPGQGAIQIAMFPETAAVLQVQALADALAQGPFRRIAQAVGLPGRKLPEIRGQHLFQGPADNFGHGFVGPDALPGLPVEDADAERRVGEDHAVEGRFFVRYPLGLEPGALGGFQRRVEGTADAENEHADHGGAAHGFDRQEQGVVDAQNMLQIDIGDFVDHERRDDHRNQHPHESGAHAVPDEQTQRQAPGAGQHRKGRPQADKTQGGGGGHRYMAFAVQKGLSEKVAQKYGQAADTDGASEKAGGVPGADSAVSPAATEGEKAQTGQQEEKVRGRGNAGGRMPKGLFEPGNERFLKARVAAGQMSEQVESGKHQAQGGQRPGGALSPPAPFAQAKRRQGEQRKQGRGRRGHRNRAQKQAAQRGQAEHPTGNPQGRQNEDSKTAILDHEGHLWPRGSYPPKI